MKKSLVIMIWLSTMIAGCSSNLLTSPATQARSSLTDVFQTLVSCKSRERLDPVITVEQRDGINRFSFVCSNSADTNYSVSITYFDNEAAARSQFEVARGGNPVLCFHGYNQYEMVSGNNSNNSHIVEERHGWRAAKWIISITASYDYGYFHYNTIDFSEAVYTSGVKHGLFASGTCSMPG